LSVTRAPPGQQATALVRDGRTYFAQGDFERARACYAAAVEIAPDDMTARAGLARCERLLAESLAPLDDAGVADEYGFDAGAQGGATDPDATIVDSHGALRLAAELERPTDPPAIAPVDPRLVHQPTGSPIDELPVTALGSGAPPRVDLQAGPPDRLVGREPGARHAAGSQGPDFQAEAAMRQQAASGPLHAIAPHAPGALPPYPVQGAPGYGRPIWAARSSRFWIAIAVAIGVLCAGLGLLIGFAAFGGDGDPAAGAPEKQVAARQARVQASEPAAPRAAPRPVPAGSLKARVRTIEHPVVAVAEAPIDGEVARVHVKAGGAVTTGQKLYTLRDGTGVRAAEIAVEAAAAGRIERRAARGEKVQKGTVLAQLVDPEVWQVVADMSSEEVGTAWSCAVASADGRERAPCRIEGVQKLGAEQSRVTASASASAAWLQRGGELVLSVSPPGSGAGP
jgi:Tetratricopeptide repeat